MSDDEEEPQTYALSTWFQQIVGKLLEVTDRYENNDKYRLLHRKWGRGALMVSALDSGASAPGSSPGRGHCVVFLGKTLHSHSASLHPGV